MAACKIKDVMQSMEEVELEILHVSSARKWWMDFLPQLENDTMFLSHLESVIENGELAYSR